MSIPKILTPYSFSGNNKTIHNRTVLAAMTNKQSHKDGEISEDEINWLARRAKGEFGLLTTAATNVSCESKAWSGQFGVYKDSYIPRLTKLTSSIHETESLIVAQLFHGGLRCPQSLTNHTPISASELDCKESFSGKSKKAEEKDIKKIIDDFTRSAVRCVKSGFDGVELHAAHGYLISQFLGKKSNLRKDEWGGSLKKRSRLLVEIFKSIRKNVPDSFIVGVRISPEIEILGIDLLDSIELVRILKDVSVDFIHLSCWNAFSRSLSLPNNKRTLTEIITKSFDSLPCIISTGSVWSCRDARDIINQGADLVGVGRVAIGHPDWPKNLNNLLYNPKRPPFSVSELEKSKLNPTFISYMKNWEGFVK
tara:strand:- start:471 stop:1568 length:1098 start_codon:yes stop_codon:yes gene_type:complete